MNTLLSTTCAQSSPLLDLTKLRPGETCQLDMREISCDPYLTNQRWEEMLTNFEVAVSAACARFGQPVARVREADAQAIFWTNRINQPFKKLVAWQNREHHWFFILLENQENSSIIRLIAGMTA